MLSYEQYQEEVWIAIKTWIGSIRKKPENEVASLKEEAENLIAAWKEFYPRRRTKISETVNDMLAKALDAIQEVK